MFSSRVEGCHVVDAMPVKVSNTRQKFVDSSVLFVRFLLNTQALSNHEVSDPVVRSHTEEETRTKTKK